MDNNQNKMPLICAFDFNEDMFRSYYQLRMRPHERSAGFKIAIAAFINLIPLVALFAIIIVGIQRVSGQNGEYAEMMRMGAAVLMPILGVISIAAFFVIIYGIRSALGLRQPRWGSSRWNARTKMVFDALLEGETAKPAIPGTYSWTSPIRTFFLPCIYLAWIGASWHNEPLFYDATPGLIPRFSKENLALSEKQAPYCVRFEVRFYEDHFEKGSLNSPVSFYYHEVFDVLEDNRFPNLAIIRINDKESEVVVDKYAFNQGSWAKAQKLLNCK